MILPLFIRIFGPQVFIIKHLANDWMVDSFALVDLVALCPFTRLEPGFSCGRTFC
jgi:hypothetical protein